MTMSGEPRGLYGAVIYYTPAEPGGPRLICAVGMARDAAGNIYPDCAAYLLSDGTEVVRAADALLARDAWMSGDVRDERDIPPESEAAAFARAGL
jgi:hypothetical protein